MRVRLCWVLGMLDGAAQRVSGACVTRFLLQRGKKRPPRLYRRAAIADKRCVEPTDTAPLERLASRIETQLDVLRHACFRFEVLHAVVTAGKQEWLPESNADLEQALGALKESDRGFRMSLADAAVSLGLSPESTLREVASVAPEPWDFVFAKHREGIEHWVGRAGELGRANNQILRKFLAAANAALALIGGDPSFGYDETGSEGTVSGSIGLVDMSI